MKQNFTKDNIINFGKNFMEKFTMFDASGIAAQSAYYLLFSIFPLLMFFVTLLPYFNIKVSMIQEQLNNLQLPPDFLDTINKFLKLVLEQKDNSASVIALLITLWSASSAINCLVKSINRIYDGEFTRKGFVFRIISIFLTIAFVLAMLINITIFTVGTHFVNHYNLQAFAYILDILKIVVGPGIIFLFFFLLYNFSPSVKLDKKTLLPGSILATVLILIFSMVFSEFFGVFNDKFSKYGIFSSIMLLLLWLNSLGLITMIGAICNSTIQDMSSKSYDEESII